MTQPATTSGSFFNCKTNPPWDLQEVLRALKQDTRRRPLPSLNGAQSTIGRLRRYKGERNAPRGLRRFLTCYRVLVKDEVTGKVYFDSQQGEVLLESCNKGQEPTLPSGSLEDQLVRLKAEYETVQASDASSEDEQPADPLDTMSEEELEAYTRPPSPAPDQPPVIVEEIASAHTPKRVMVPAPAPEPAPAPSPEPKARRIPRPLPSIIQVMYLTPTEAAIWAEVAQRARCYSSTSWRLGIPKDAQTMYARWRPDSLDCDEEDLYAALQRFVDHGVLKCLGETRGNQGTYTLFLDPDWTQVRRIEARQEHVLNAESVRSVRVAQSGERSSGPGRALAEELGIIGFNPNTRLPWRCVKGFEKVEFVLPETVTPASRVNPAPPNPVRTSPAPAPTRSIAPVPALAPTTPSMPTSTETVRELTDRRDDLQARIEAAQADIATWTIQRAACDAKLRLLQDAIRQEALERKAKIAAQQAALAAQQAEIDRELAALSKS